MNTIRLGLPKGSLNNKYRGNTYQLLIDAGYEVRGYEPGSESDKNLEILNDPAFWNATKTRGASLKNVE